MYTLVFRTNVGTSWAGSVIVSGLILILLVTGVTAATIRWRTDDMWHVRHGVDGAVILLTWNGRHDRRELDTWATWRHHRGLGRLVLAAALADAPRPLWLNPATPNLRQFYLARVEGRVRSAIGVE